MGAGRGQLRLTHVGMRMLAPHPEVRIVGGVQREPVGG